MMQMLKIMFIILVGIGMLIMGIYTFIRLKKRRRELKRLLDNIASGSTVDQLLKENHPKLSAMDEMEKYIYIIMGLGAGFVLFGAFFMAQELMERHFLYYNKYGLFSPLYLHYFFTNFHYFSLCTFIR